MMATGPEHYRMAEALLAACQLTDSGDDDCPEVYPAIPGNDGVDEVSNTLRAAQVHATLALAAATALPEIGNAAFIDDDRLEWSRATATTS